MKGKFSKEYLLVILSGLFVGAAAVALSAWGNPANMGFCIACFLRDIAGALKLHSTAAVQYMRPEIAGLVIGSLVIALARREFRPMGGSSPVTRFILGMIVMMGALVFLGCPLRMIIRIGGGDLNALLGLVGFIAGILIGSFALKRGFGLKRAYKQSKLEGLLFPLLMLVLFILSLIVPGLFASSIEGPGSKHAPWLAAFAIAIVAGALSQQSRLCLAGGIRDIVLFRDFKLILGFAAILVAVFAGNLILGNFSGFAYHQAGNTVIANPDGLWNFLGMALVGWGSVLLGGCPLRQLILAGEGNSDSAITVLGLIAGAAISHSFGLASSANGIGSGPVAIVSTSCFILLAVITLLNMNRKEA